MKRQNKIFKSSIAIVLISAMLAAIGIGAYLTSTDVKNDVYTVGNVSAEIIANGDMEINNVGALLPGTVHTYERAATNTGINDAYVFMSITIPYEMIGVADIDGTQLGEKTMQIFIPGSADGYVSSEWKLVDSGFIGQYEIEKNEQLNGEHEQHSTVVGNTITYVYGYIGDNADGSLKALASGETTSNLVEEMKLTNLYNASKITGEVSTKLYAIQDKYVNGGLTDVNGVWAVINSSLINDKESGNNNTNGDNNGSDDNVVEDDVIEEDKIITYHTLIDGSTFRSKIPSAATSVEFIAMPQTYGLSDRTAPEGAIDVSADGDGSIMAWLEDTTFYVVAMDGGIILANTNCSYMFQNKPNLINISFDNLDMSQVESAGRMFEKCTGLTEISIPDGTKEIEAYAFYGCSNLTTVIIPKSVEMIGNGAFYMCYAMKTVYVPKNVRIMDSYTFSGTSLEEINIDPANEYFCSVDGVVFTKDMKTLVQYPSGRTDKTYEIPEGVEIIDERSFECGNIRSIIVPTSVSTFDAYALANCTNLSTLNYRGTKEQQQSISFGIAYLMNVLNCKWTYNYTD